MNKNIFFFASLILIMLLVSSFSHAASSNLSNNSTAVCNDENCSDPWSGCKQKVKVVGRDGDCVTFACEVGTKNEHIIKTNDKEGKKTLFKLAEESLPDTGTTVIWPDSF